MINEFTHAEPIDAAVIDRFAPIAPPGAVEMWREHGTGWFSQGFVRIADPAHAEEMLQGVYRLPPDSVAPASSRRCARSSACCASTATSRRTRPT